MNPPVKVGQIWASKDPRDVTLVIESKGIFPPFFPSHEEPRMFRIESVCGQKVVVRNTKTRRTTEISLRRLSYSLGVRGYKLVRDVSDYPYELRGDP